MSLDITQSRCRRSSLSASSEFIDGDPQYVLASANYEADGELGSLDVEGAKQGDHVLTSFEGFYTKAGLNYLKTPERYGVPSRLNLQQYNDSGHLQLPATKLPEELAIVNRHCGYNEIIQQNLPGGGRIVSTRYLKPSVTEEERGSKPFATLASHNRPLKECPP